MAAPAGSDQVNSRSIPGRQGSVPRGHSAPHFSAKSAHRSVGAKNNSKMRGGPLTSIKVIFPSARSVLCHLVLFRVSPIWRCGPCKVGFFHGNVMTFPCNSPDIVLLLKLEFPCRTGLDQVRSGRFDQEETRKKPG